VPRPEVGRPPRGRSADRYPFGEALNRVASRLDLPQPERTRILEEILTDLQDLKAGLVNRGWSPEDAEARTVRLLVPSEPAIDALIRLHEPLYQRLTRRLSPSVMRRAERAILLLVTAGVLGPMLSSLFGSGVLSDPSPLLWGVIALAAVILLLAGRRAKELFLIRDHHPGTLRNGLGRLLVGSGVSLGVGVAGLVLELYGLAAAVEASGLATTELIVPWLLDSSALLSASLITALLGGLCWFLLVQKVEMVERANERAAMLLRETASPTGLPVSEFDDSRTFNERGTPT